MANKCYNKIFIENAKIINHFPFKNFSGEATSKTPAGSRSFCVYIPEDMVDKLRDDGWNIKIDRDNDGNVRGHFLPVAIRYDIPKYVPDIFKVNEGTMVKLKEGMVSELDRANIISMDVIIRPHNYDGGVKAFLEQMYVTIEQNRFEKKYANKRIIEDDFVEDDNTPF